MGVRIELQFRSLGTATGYGLRQSRPDRVNAPRPHARFRFGLLPALTILGLMTALALSPAKAPAAESAATPRFESAACPLTAEPIPALHRAVRIPCRSREPLEAGEPQHPARGDDRAGCFRKATAEIFRSFLSAPLSPDTACAAETRPRTVHRRSGLATDGVAR